VTGSPFRPAQLVTFRSTSLSAAFDIPLPQRHLELGYIHALSERQRCALTIFAWEVVSTYGPTTR
jgi:hypothetical protein